MIRRLFALAALLFYGSIERVTGLMPEDLDYPDDDTLASSPAGAARAVEQRGLAARLLAG